MPKASEVAAEFRKLADTLDTQPELEVVMPFIYFTYRYMGTNAKDLFMAFVKLMPRPFEKKYSETDLHLIYNSKTIRIDASIERSKVCRLVEPAKTIPAVYECEPLLSAEEENSLEVAL